MKAFTYISTGLLIVLSATASDVFERAQQKPISLVFDERPYVRFMIARPGISADSDKATVLDLKDCDKDTSLQTEDTTRVQWARNKAQDTTKDKCQTFQLERLPWEGKNVFGIRISANFVAAGRLFGLAFGRSQENGNTGDAKLDVYRYDPVWDTQMQFTIECKNIAKAGQPYFGRNCDIKFGRPGKDQVCLTAPNSAWTEGGASNGPLGIEPCDSERTDRWHLIKAGARFTQESHEGGWVG